jgi:hypothetical protein
MNVVATIAFMTRKKVLAVLVLLLFACRLHSAESPSATEVKLPVLKVGNEVYSNVTVTAVTATDIYFTYNRGMGNAKLKRLNPELQKKFHFDPEKAREREAEEQKVTASYRLRIERNTNRPSASPDELDPNISVQTSEATFQDNRYDPIYDRPHNLREQGAKFDCTFAFDADFTTHTLPATNRSFAFRIDATKISIGMDMSITEPSTPNRSLQNHLEGHKRIYAYFYALGPKAAERAARVIGNGKRIVSRDSKDLETAKESFLYTSEENAKMEYYCYTRNPAEAAASYFDDLTDYGRNLKDTDEAVQEAIQHCEVPIPDVSTDPAPRMWVEAP